MNRSICWRYLGYFVVLATLHSVGYGLPEVMTNHWYVRLHDDVTPLEAQHIAKRNGFAYVRPVRFDTDP